MDYASVKRRLKQLGISQREVVGRLIHAGFYFENERNSLEARICMALNGKRQSERDVLLLQQTEFLLSRV